MSDFSFVSEHKARKVHNCTLCDRNIKPGESYTRRDGKWDDEFFAECYHPVCWTIVNAYWASDMADEMWDSSDVREWLEDKYCWDCMDPDADLDDECEVPVFRCRKIIEKLTGKDGDAV